MAVTDAEKVDVVVVGTGWNGLISAKTYLEFAPNTNLILVDDQSSIGGVWNKEKIYPSLYAQIKFGLFEYSCKPMRREGITSDGYISGATINTYLEEFAEEYGLVKRTRLRTKVVNVARLENGKAGWRLEIEDGKPIECDKLIYASGATSHAVVPTWPKSPGFSVPIIHSAETGTSLDSLFKARRVVVVGAAKSAYDTVFLLLQAGIAVDWIIREDGTGPLAIMPPTILGLVNSMDVISTKAMASLGSSIMRTQGFAYHFFQRTWAGRLVAGGFWRTVNAIAELHAGYSKSSNANKLRPLPHGNGIFWANAGLGCASVPNFWKVFHEGDCTVHRSEIASLDGDNAVTLLNGQRIRPDQIVLCTGFRKSYSTFSPELQAELGLAADPARDARDKWDRLDAAAEVTVDRLLPILAHAPVPPTRHEKATAAVHGPSRHYRRLIVPSLAAQGDRSIAFPGFIHSIYTPIVSEVQALWSVTFLLGLHDPPVEHDMEVEVAVWNAWCRKRYLAQGRKHAYAIFDFLSYVDLLLKDLGIKTKRRSNPFVDFFMPAYPRTYKGLVDEFKSAHGLL